MKNWSVLLTGFAKTAIALTRPYRHTIDPSGSLNRSGRVCCRMQNAYTGLR